MLKMCWNLAFSLLKGNQIFSLDIKILHYYSAAIHANRITYHCTQE